MFDKFGEFGSSEEINKAAEELINAGKLNEIEELAKENGISAEEVEDYIADPSLGLTSVLSAAVAKLELEKKDLKLSGVLLDWVNELLEMCTDVPGFAAAVRNKGKDLAGYIALTAEKGYENRCVVDKRIVDKAKKIKSIVGAHEFSIGIPDKKTRRELATKYYMEDKA